ncbi:MAG: lysylphosphatidylglycerol synthase transmembrane domain-containing protein [Planctomycetota bacterium]|jgi:uncharacterized protein (TIRG00374 family)
MALGIACGAVFLYLAVRNESPSEVLAALAGISVPLLILSTILGQGANGLRGLRWGFLLRKDVSIKVLYPSMMIGYMANMFLPVRMGELVRMELLSRRGGVRRGEAFLSVGLEKIVDGLSLLLVIGIVAVTRELPEWVAYMGWISLAIFGGLAAGVLITLIFKERVRAILDKLVSRDGKITVHIHSFVDSIISELELLKDIKAWLGVIFYTVLVWVAEMFGVWLLFRAAGLHLDPLESLFVVAVLTLATMVPSPPGYVGTFELFTKQALGLFGVAGAKALGTTLILHTQVLIVTALVGVICMVSTGMRVRTSPRTGPSEEPKEPKEAPVPGGQEAT